MARIEGSVGRRGRNIPADVRTIKNLINRHLDRIPPTPPVEVNGACGQPLIFAIKAFQARVVGLRNPDGRVDPGGRTLANLNGEPGTPGSMPVRRWHYPAGPQEGLIEKARPFIGATEGRNNTIGSDPRMREIFEADWIANGATTDGYPWCCSFVSLCCQKFLADDFGIYSHVRPPRTAGVTSFRTRWAVQNNCLIFPPDDPHTLPHKGDVVVYTFSHIGIVDTVHGGHVMTIEGNTNAAGSREGTTVRSKRREYGVIRCFIRFPVPAEYDTENQMCRVLEPVGLR